MSFEKLRIFNPVADFLKIHKVGFLASFLILHSFLLQLFPILQKPLSFLASHVFKEDAFYYLVPAMDLSQGGSLSLSGEENPTNGYHPLWMIINILVTHLPVNTLLLPKIIVSLQWIISVTAWYIMFCILQIKNNPRDYLLLLISYVSWFCTPLSSIWLNGMESPLSALVIVLILWRLKSDNFQANWKLGLLVGLLALCRVDYLILAFILTIISLVANLSEFNLKRGLRQFSTLKLKKTFEFVLSYSLVITPYFISNILIFKTILPISGEVKDFYANESSQSGLRNIGVNYLNFLRNFVTNVSGGYLPRNITTFLTLLLVVLIISLSLKLLLKDQSTLDKMTSLLFLFVCINTFVVTFRLGSFSSDAYINWYYSLLYVALIFLGGLATCRMKILRLVPSQVISYLLISTIFLQHQIYQNERFSRTDKSPFVLLAEGLNSLTPQDARIASFSSGTMAFLIKENRRMFNLDGLINSKKFAEDYLVSGRLQKFLCENNIEYFADSSADLEVSALTWLKKGGVQTLFTPENSRLIDQGPSWGNQYLNIVEIGCGNIESVGEPNKGVKSIRYAVFRFNTQTQMENKVQDFKSLPLRIEKVTGEESQRAVSQPFKLSKGTYRVQVEGNLSDISNQTSLLTIEVGDWQSKVMLMQGDFPVFIDNATNFRKVIFFRSKNDLESIQFVVRNTYSFSAVEISKIEISKIPGYLVQD